MLRPDLGLARHVHLQGWGEPLLHPRLFTMIEDAAGAGCSTGITTNGDLLHETMNPLLSSALDYVAISVAGDAPTHARLRDGSRLDDILAAAEALARGRRGGRGIHVRLTFLLTASSTQGLPSIITRAAEAGIRDIVVNHLDNTPTAWHLEEAAFDDRGLKPGVSAALEEASRIAGDCGVDIVLPTEVPRDLLVCSLHPECVAFVSHDGRVGPCVNLLLPFDGSIPRSTKAGILEIAPVVWGRVSQGGLRTILDDEARLRFLDPLKSRLEAESRFVASIDGSFGSEALRRLDEADAERSEALARNPFPPPCKGCHQRYW